MLYHRDVHLPRKIRNLLPTRRVNLKYGSHAISAAQTDRYGSLPLPSTIDIKPDDMVEAEVYNGKLHKVVIRIACNATLDLCMAIIPGEWFVKTVWANERTDNHQTLNRSYYVRNR